MNSRLNNQIKKTTHHKYLINLVEFRWRCFGCSCPSESFGGRVVGWMWSEWVWVVWGLYLGHCACVGVCVGVVGRSVGAVRLSLCSRILLINIILLALASWLTRIGLHINSTVSQRQSLSSDKRLRVTAACLRRKKKKKRRRGNLTQRKRRSNRKKRGRSGEGALEVYGKVFVRSSLFISFCPSDIIHWVLEFFDLILKTRVFLNWLRKRRHNSALGS